MIHFFIEVQLNGLNKKQGEPEVQWVKLTLDRINQNVKDYLERKMQTDKEYSKDNIIEDSGYNSGLPYNGEDR